MAEITIQPVRRLIKKAGAKRISDKAAEELAAMLEKRSANLLAEAHKISQHSGRRTVMRKDIKMAKATLKK